MIYDPAKAKGYADFCASPRCSSPRESRLRYMVDIDWAEIFHGRVPSITFSMARAYIISSIIISMHYSLLLYLVGSIGALNNSIIARITRARAFPNNKIGRFNCNQIVLHSLLYAIGWLTVGRRDARTHDLGLNRSCNSSHIVVELFLSIFLEKLKGKVSWKRIKMVI